MAAAAVALCVSDAALRRVAIAVRRRMWRSADADDMEDMMQEGRIAAFKASSSYDPACGASPATWARNKAEFAMRDYARAHRCLLAVSNEAKRTPGALPVVTHAPLRMLETAAQEDTERDAVDRAAASAILSLLSPRQRVAALLTAQTESQSEAGRRWGCSQQTVLYHLRAARQRLREAV